jgi:ribonuclease III
MKTEKSVDEFANKHQLKFNNQSLLQQVFVHRSYLNEHRSFPLQHNERLEFLGDAVLELVATEYLYLRYENPEGELTNWRSALVRGEMIAKIANELGMNDYLLLSKGEQQSEGRARQLILANSFEALIGAIYLDQGYAVAQKFLEEHLLHHLEDVLSKRLHIDAKSDFQEKSQDQLGITPNYNVLETTGPDHDRVFVVGVYLEKELVAKGEGRSKQKAEQAAAESALSEWDRTVAQLKRS